MRGAQRVDGGLGDATATTGDFTRFFNRVEALRNVTSEDVRRVARRVFTPSRRSCVVGLPAGASQ